MIAMFMPGFAELVIGCVCCPGILIAVVAGVLVALKQRPRDERPRDD